MRLNVWQTRCRAGGLQTFTCEGIVVPALGALRPCAVELRFLLFGVQWLMSLATASVRVRTWSFS